MAFLIDSNVLVLSSWDGHPAMDACVGAMELLLRRGESMLVLPQNLAEFWNACTRPLDKNGLGLDVAEADARLQQLESMLFLVYESPDSFARWRSLVVEQQVRGVQVHDARIAAALLTYEIESLLTYNPRDFARFGVQCVTPGELLASL